MENGRFILYGLWTDRLGNKKIPDDHARGDDLLLPAGQGVVYPNPLRAPYFKDTKKPAHYRPARGGVGSEIVRSLHFKSYCHGHHFNTALRFNIVSGGSRIPFNVETK